MTQKIDTQIVAADVNADQAPAKRNAQFVCYSLAAVAAMTVQGLQKALENLAGKSGDLQRSLAKVFFELSRREGSPKKVTAWARDAIGLDLQTECQAVYECAALLRAMDSGKVTFAEEDFDNLPISVNWYGLLLREGMQAERTLEALLHFQIGLLRSFSALRSDSAFFSCCMSSSTLPT